MSADLGLTDVQRAVLHLLYSARGRLVEGMPPETAPAMADLEERGLIWRAGPGRGWWLTADGQTIVEADV